MSRTLRSPVFTSFLPFPRIMRLSCSLSSPIVLVMNTSLTASQIHSLAVLAPSARKAVLALVSMDMPFAYAFALVSA